MRINQENLFAAIRNTKKPGYWSRWSSPGRMLPKFIVLGAQRCGTSSFFAMLKKHPDFRVPLRKEIHYFDLERYPKRLGYQAWFPLKKASGFTVDITPSYIFAPWAIKAATKTLPEMRYLLFLRDPVERALSHYRKELRTGRETRSIKNAFAPLWECQKNLSCFNAPVSASNMSFWLHKHYLLRGHYLEQLQNCEKIVGKNNIMIICSENFFTAPQKHIDLIAEFTGIKKWSTNHSIHRNKTEKLSVPGDLKKRLQTYYKPLNESLFNHLGHRFPWGDDA